MSGKQKFIDFNYKPYVLSDHETRPSAPYQFLYFVGKILSVRLWVSQKTWGKKYLAEYFHTVWAGIHDWREGVVCTCLYWKLKCDLKCQMIENEKVYL